MSDQLIIEIPSSVDSRFIIATDTTVKHPGEFTHDLLTTKLVPEEADKLNLWRQKIGPTKLRIHSYVAEHSPWYGQLSDVIARGAEHQRPLAASHHLAIESTAPPEHQPQTAQTVRLVARILARATDGQLADPDAAHLLPCDGQSGHERAWFCLADHWIGIDCRINPSDDSTPTTRCACLSLFTRGLARFALPDLLITQMPCAYDLAATNLMRSLAVKLLTQLWRQPGTRELRLDRSTTLTPAHAWGYWGAHPRDGQPVDIRLSEAEPAGLPSSRYLAILPHLGFRGTHAEWAAQALDQHMLAEIAHGFPDDPPFRIDMRLAGPKYKP